MNPGASRKIDWIAVVGRCCVGLFFIYLGMNKVLDPVGFLKLLRQYHLPVDYWFLNGIAATLPWFEVFCGLLLILGIAVRGTSIVMLAMLVPFTVIVTHRALEIATIENLAFCAVKFDCGCGVGKVYICAKILENCALMGISAWLAAGAGNKAALRYGLLKNGTYPSEKPVSIASGVE